MRLLTKLALLLLVSSNCWSAYATSNTVPYCRWQYVTLNDDFAHCNLQENGGTSVRITPTVCGPGGNNFQMINNNNALFGSTGLTDTAAASTIGMMGGFFYITAFTNVLECAFCQNAGDNMGFTNLGKVTYISTGGTLLGSTTLSTNTCYWVDWFWNGTTDRRIHIKANPPTSMNFVATQDGADSFDGHPTTGNMIFGRGFAISTYIVGYMNYSQFWNLATVPTSFPPPINLNTNRDPDLFSYPSPYIGASGK